MAFPWNRGDADVQVAPEAGRRRARTRRMRQEEARGEPSRLTREKRHQRVAVGIGAGLLLVILGVVSFGFYQEFVKPPRVWAGSVRNVEFTMGDLVMRIRVLQGYTGRVDLSTVPFEYLRDLLNAEVLRQAAPGLGISITDEGIEQALRDRFYPIPPAGQESDPGQLDEEFRNNYQINLARTGLTDAEFRVILGEQIALQQLRFLLGQGIEDTQEQVEVEWLRLDIEGRLDISGVRKRLDNEPFAKVAGEVANPGQFADQTGYVGWVPRGAFPDLDDTLFGDEERDRQALEVGEISQPLFTQDGIYIIHKLTGLTEQDLSGSMGVKLNTELVVKWQNEQQLIGSGDGWLKMNFNSKWYSWVADQVQLSAPRTPQGQGPLQGQR